ncbi:MAG: hypothetical protein CMP10_02650 [Zetaproteobacteria bacterium]|nr:hypothetical protein [Pseudobdellovibrionaceae bacterium]
MFRRLMSRSMRYKLRGWSYVFAPPFLEWLQRLLLWTCRIEVKGGEHLQGHAGSWIFGIWHTNVFLSPLFLRDRKVAVLISQSHDGELIHRMVQRYGNDSIRGSTSKGGAHALRALVKHLRQGLPGAITPDGPRGPAWPVQDGIVLAASLSGVPVIPCHYEADRQWVFRRTWDQHRLPKPFSRICLSYGAPVKVPRDLVEHGAVDQMRQKVEQAMMTNMRYCQELVGG